ncbi:unnamed protein product [Protopolystoma xenopodis]|uniref:Uncharacterized protein n=1 Tax=Protopolystoma xenopodis TaxID=117903 RepID=A0A3S4ZR94_9PLAT|nr:unnamed protein product [Protopolystoma xenopodis]
MSVPTRLVGRQDNRPLVVARLAPGLDKVMGGHGFRCWLFITSLEPDLLAHLVRAPWLKHTHNFEPYLKIDVETGQKYTPIDRSYLLPYLVLCGSKMRYVTIRHVLSAQAGRLSSLHGENVCKSRSSCMRPTRDDRTTLEPHGTHGALQLFFRQRTSLQTPGPTRKDTTGVRYHKKQHDSPSSRPEERRAAGIALVMQTANPRPTPLWGLAWFGEMTFR